MIEHPLINCLSRRSAGWNVLSGRGAPCREEARAWAAIAKRLASEGAVVTVADINVEKGEECVGQIEAAGGSAQFVQANVAKDDMIQRTSTTRSSGAAASRCS